MTAGVRESAVAGSWYAGSPDRLRADVEEFLAGVSQQAPEGELVGLISPHAGLVYSGPVAAYGYSLLRGRRNLTALLIGPSHRLAFEGCVVWAAGEWRTPLGAVPIDADLACRLVDSGAVRADDDPHLPEHSIEMQLPFLQHLVEGLRIVPVLMGAQTRETVFALAEAVSREALSCAQDVLLVASSDLSHYHPAPVAGEMDALVVGDVDRFDSEGLMRRLEARHEHACGGGPMVAVLEAAKRLGAVASTVLRYADSGDVGPRDKSQVVGYLSAALTRVAT